MMSGCLRLSVVPRCLETGVGLSEGGVWVKLKIKCHESELWKSKAGVLVYKDRGGLKIDLATGQN